MQRIVAVDPGPERSAMVTLWADNTLDVDPEIDNEKMVTRIGYEAAVIAALERDAVGSFIAIEDMTPYGSALNYATIATLKWMGRFYAAAEGVARVEWITRVAVKQHLLGQTRGTDAMVSDALRHIFGGESSKGTKRNPGPLYAVKGHAWAALAVAVTARGWRAENGLLVQKEARG